MMLFISVEIHIIHANEKRMCFIHTTSIFTLHSGTALLGED